MNLRCRHINSSAAAPAAAAAAAPAVRARRHAPAVLAGLCAAFAIGGAAEVTGADALAPGPSAGAPLPPATPAATAAAGPARLAYPRVERGDTIDVYHGTRVADPYRELEAAEAPATRRFVAEQNRLAQPWLEALPQRAWIKSRLGALWNYERVGVPRKEGGRYFFLRNDGRQNQSVLWWSASLQSAPRVLVDPNASRADATVAIARFEPSPDGKVVAYALSDGGTDWETWRFRRVDDGVDLPDELRFTKFWEFSWSRDGKGVWYSRYPARGAGEAGTGEARGDDQAQPVVHFHRLGEPQSADRPVYAVTDHPTRAPSAHVTDDGRWLVVSLFDGYERNAIDLLELGRAGARPRRLFGAWDALYTVIGSEGDTFWVQTTQAAPRGRVIAVDARHPEPARWREVVPQSDAALVASSLVGSRLVASYVRDAHGVARLFEKDGRPAGDVPVPGLGTIEGFTGHGGDAETFFSYADYLNPARVLRYDTASNQASVFRAPQVAADTSRYVTRQVFYASRDGTRVPMFVTHRRDLVLDGTAPTLLYGYGGFSISLTPAFRPATLTWLEMGGVYAEANLRGGGEYGEAWHQAGTTTRKQNVFDDFVAAAEWLVAQRYTRPSRLAISGRSNGGLLVGAVLVQRPDLFGAALPAVGVLDMLRYHTASANARQWSSDYGLSEVAEQFRALRAYSPVHNVREGTCYPPTLVTTADRDDRVVPWHSYKFAAALQHAQGCTNPVLLRVETRAGHGAGKPVWMQVEDHADQWAFAARALGIELPPPDGVAPP
jgi:prolyl oligopeptidase